MNMLIKTMVFATLIASCGGCAYTVHDPYQYGYYGYPGYGETKYRLGVDAGLSVSETHAHPHPYPYIYRGGCAPFCL